MKAETWRLLVASVGLALYLGVPVEGLWRSHQVPIDTVRDDPAHLRLLEGWLRSYRPEELFDDGGAFRASLASLVATAFDGPPRSAAASLTVMSPP